MRFTCTMAVCLLVGLSSHVIADTISYSTPITPNGQAVDIGSANATVYLPQFNPAMGTLTSVTLRLDATTTGGSIIWDNESTSPTEVTLGIGTKVTAVGPGILVLIATPFYQESGIAPVDDTDDPYEPEADFAGNDIFVVTGGTGMSAFDEDSPSDFTPYIGTGDISIAISSIVYSLFIGEGGKGESRSSGGTYNGSVEVLYTYTPEPATMCLMASGFGALLLRRKRR